MSALCINTEVLEARSLPMPKSWANLKDPASQKQLVIPNPNSSGTGFLTVSAFLQLFGEDEGWAYMDALNQNIAEYTDSGSAPCKMAGAGDYPIGLSFGYQAILQKEQEPVVAVFPAEGSGWKMEANALIKKDPIKPAAKTFLDRAISDSAMKAYSTSYPITAVQVSQPPPGYAANPVSQLIDNNFLWAAANRDRILKEWTKRYEEAVEPGLPTQ